ncbi:hypothetical protein Dimus_027235, partial [Dionaea muscipula]
IWKWVVFFKLGDAQPWRKDYGQTGIVVEPSRRLGGQWWSLLSRRPSVQTVVTGCWATERVRCRASNGGNRAGDRAWVMVVEWQLGVGEGDYREQQPS